MLENIIVFCPPLVPYPVKVMSLSGHTLEFLIREQELVRDLKEKISLKQGLGTDQQRLVFKQQELLDSSTFQSCGIRANATLHLVLAATAVEPGVVNYSCPSFNPILSIHHLYLDLHLELLMERLVSPASPRHISLSSHLSHVVHFHNGQHGGFLLFLHYLYTGQLKLTIVGPGMLNYG